mmetsp:Transcript_1364/g.5515  ORF Transcript_1364/g.5515 Transcript_1364/m.5515 type:complete len:260 (-) Transcript_1364:30-809(-)
MSRPSCLRRHSSARWRARRRSGASRKSCSRRSARRRWRWTGRSWRCRGSRSWPGSGGWRLFSGAGTWSCPRPGSRCSSPGLHSGPLAWTRRLRRGVAQRRPLLCRVEPSLRHPRASLHRFWSVAVAATVQPSLHSRLFRGRRRRLGRPRGPWKRHPRPRSSWCPMSHGNHRRGRRRMLERRRLGGRGRRWTSHLGRLRSGRRSPQVLLLLHLRLLFGRMHLYCHLVHRHQMTLCGLIHPLRRRRKMASRALRRRRPSAQ